MTDVAAELGRVLETGLVSTDPAERAGHAADWTPEAQLRRRSGASIPLPACVVRPRHTGDVVRILQWAHDSGTPVVPFGGGSGVCGAISPTTDSIVLDMRSMRRIVSLDERSRTVTVEAGALGPELESALNERSFTLGHEPQSHAISTVGGWIATRACGQLSARYGGIEDSLAGFEAVLPGGRALRSKAIPRRATGPDVASLMIGSEGALGVITEATLRIWPRPSQRTHRCLRFDHMADGVTACRHIAQSNLRPTLVRLYDAEDAAIFLRKHPEQEPGPLLLLTFDDDHSEQRADAAVRGGGGVPGPEELVTHWWEHRNDAVEEFRELMAGRGLLGPHGMVDTIEVSGSWSDLRDLYHSMKRSLSEISALCACHLSHVYTDGACLYFTLAQPCEDDIQAAEVNTEWWDTAMRACLDSGGSISHHHGIGRLKARWLPEELNGWWEVLVAVKKAIDPRRIMNPGALGL